MELSPEASAALALLANQVRTGRLTQQHLQRVTGVHQSQISRILTGQAKRMSRNVEKLCKYARALSKPDGTTNSVGAEELQESILAIWDGSVEHAQSLKSLLDALTNFQSTILHRRQLRDC